MDGQAIQMATPTFQTMPDSKLTLPTSRTQNVDQTVRDKKGKEGKLGQWAMPVGVALISIPMP